MKPNSLSRARIVLIAVSAFLHGIVVGVAGFAVWAQYSGMLNGGAVFAIVFPFGVVAAGFLALLPCLIYDTLTAYRRFQSVSAGRGDPQKPEVHGSAV